MSGGGHSFFEELKRRKVVRVGVVYLAVAYAVAEAADLIFPRLGLPEWSVTLVMALALAGLPIAIVLAWAFDVTDRGLVRTDDSVASTPSASSNWLSLKAISVAAILVAVGAAAGWLAGRGGEAESVDATFDSIAVLPFADMSPDSDMEYFGDGMAEEILNVLAKLPDLRVAGRTSSFSFKGKDDDIRSIGEALDVATLLEGSIRRSGSAIRITAQLVRADDQSHLWSETYNRDFNEDVFVVQDDIAGAIVDALQIELAGADAPTVADQRGTDSLDAYNAYLRGRFQWNRRTYEGVTQSLELFERAIELDRGYARAYAGLADAYIVMSNYAWMRPHDAFPLARAAAERAIVLDPELADPYVSMIGIHAWYDWDFDAAERAFERAIELDPNHAFARYWYGHMLDVTNRPEQAVAQIELALGLDPLATQIRAGLATHYLYIGEADRAIEICLEVLELDPTYQNARFWMSIAQLHAGQPDEALATVAMLPDDFSNDIDDVEIWTLVQRGEVDAAREALRALSDDVAGTNVGSLVRPHAQAELGLIDEAFRDLQVWVDERQFSVVELGFLRDDHPLRADPRYEALLEQIGLLEYWQ